MSMADFIHQHKRKASDCFEHEHLLPPIAEQPQQQFLSMHQPVPPSCNNSLQSTTMGHTIGHQAQQCAFQMSVFVPPGTTPNLGASPNVGSPPSLYGGLPPSYTPPSLTSLGHSSLSSGISAHSMSTATGHALQEHCMPVDLHGVPIPLQRPLTPDGLPSVGSVGHCSGTCRRCVFFDKGRCLNGVDCNFCHLPHEKRKRTNKKRRRYPQGAAAPPPTV